MGLTSFSTGFAVGFGTGVVSRELLPFLGEIIRPVARVSLKSSIRIFERTRELIYRVGETIEDTAAEVNAELKQGRAQAEIHKESATRNKKKRIRPESTTEGAVVAPIRKVA